MGDFTSNSSYRPSWKQMSLTMIHASKKGKYSKHLEVCATDLPVFGEILRLCIANQLPISIRHVMENQKLVKKSVGNPRVWNYIRDLPRKGWAQVRSLASEMGRSRMVSKWVDQLWAYNVSEPTQPNKTTAAATKDFKISQNTAELDRVDPEATLGKN